MRRKSQIRKARKITISGKSHMKYDCALQKKDLHEKKGTIRQSPRQKTTKGEEQQHSSKRPEGKEG